MRIYKIKYKTVFSGVVEVRAEDRERAKTIINAGFNHPYLQVNSNHTWTSDSKEEEGIVDWEFDLHADKISLK